MGQTHQTPLTTNVGQATQQKPAETTRFFDLAKHRFDDHFASAYRARPSEVRTFAAIRSFAVVGGSATSASGAW